MMRWQALGLWARLHWQSGDDGVARQAGFTLGG